MAVDSTSGWLHLKNHAKDFGSAHLSELFKSDKSRFADFSFSADGFLLDISKQRINSHTLKQLLELADQQQLGAWIEKLFTGEKVNDSEGRAALHSALRSPANASLSHDGQDVMADVHHSLDKMAVLVDQIKSAQWRGFDGRPIKDVVNIGVGGSNLGPLMACDALEQCAVSGMSGLQVHFVSSMDGSELEKLLPRLNPATTLFVISSKTFSTIDTLANGSAAREWLLKASEKPLELINQHHFIAVTASPKAACAWGVPEKNQLLFWDWVGGRYSLWSAIGLPIALKIGMDNFREILNGAHEMDVHFRQTPMEKNLPVLLGLVGIWNINFLDIHAHAILPYDGRLAELPSYLEQLEMESNGKGVNRDGERVAYRTCPVLWGEVGSNAQHAFYQLLHQGTEAVMCDFIVTAARYGNMDNGLQNQHQLSLANCLAQSRLLALGDSVMASDEGASHYQHYDGNQPSTTIMLDELTPKSFGGLIALYEQKVFVQSVIWGVNPFDQWGVEQGKRVATSLLAELESFGGEGSDELDGSTQGLIRHAQKQGKEQQR